VVEASLHMLCATDDDASIRRETGSIGAANSCFLLHKLMYFCSDKLSSVAFARALDKASPTVVSLR
jgi:hypothetical protein